MIKRKDIEILKEEVSKIQTPLAYTFIIDLRDASFKGIKYERLVIKKYEDHANRMIDIFKNEIVKPLLEALEYVRKELGGII